MMNLREEAKKELMSKIYEDPSVKAVVDSPIAPINVNEYYKNEDAFIEECNMYINFSDRAVMLERGIDLDSILRTTFKEASSINSTIAELLNKVFTALANVAIDLVYPIPQE